VRIVLTSALLLAIALSPAHAHHRQTPPIVAMSTSGDAALPRLAPPSRKAIAITVDGAVSVLQPFRKPLAHRLLRRRRTPIPRSAERPHGRIDSDADPLNTGAPGRQIVRTSSRIAPP
jgi:hypothetical protein